MSTEQCVKKAKRTVVYIHGQGGDPGEADAYQPCFPVCRVVGLPYTARNPWGAKEEFPRLFETICAGADAVELLANSIGAYFAMQALADKPIVSARLISPIVDMERLILDRMCLYDVDEAALRNRGEVAVDDGDPLSFAYLRYVREHPVHWNIPTHILYGEKDALTSYETVRAFAHTVGASLTVMPGGEHWFHTEKEMAFLFRWIRETA